MAKPPAVIMIARHGMRLDAADPSWHMSTPTPYDPPLTYGGWNQCRALGMRIASILDAREQELNSDAAESITVREESTGTSLPKRKRRKHKVVIHTSPFLRCVQTSIGISAGIAQYKPVKDNSNRSNLGRNRVEKQLHSASPRLRGADGAVLTHSLSPIYEPQDDLDLTLPKKSLSESKRYRKSKLRVDAFLGEWMNPSYFEHITPPPPSPMMVAGAKAELLHNDSVDTFTPSVPARSNGGQLWAPTPATQRPSSREGGLDDLSPLSDTLPSPVLRRDRGSSVSSVGSTDSTSGRKSPFRPGYVLQPFHSTSQKDTATTYIPPTPTYAISSSDNIPRGYVSHARQACADIDIQWDSSRAPQEWGDGGAYGEEWSEMHRRFRRGLSDLVEWYSQHNMEDRGDDVVSPGTIRIEDDVEEDLVVVLVTHGAGSNALIGALTGQPVLLDVGMANLTVAVRKDDALASPHGTLNGDSIDASTTQYSSRRRSSVDTGLNAAYDMKLVSSSEHLRLGSESSRTDSLFNSRRISEPLSKPQTPFVDGLISESPRTSLEENEESGEPRRGSTSAALGSIRRPSAPNSIVLQEPVIGRLKKSNTVSFGANSAPTTPLTFNTGLWTPPASRNAAPLSEKRLHKDEMPVKVDSVHSDDPVPHQQQQQHPMANDTQPHTVRTTAASDAVESYMDAKPNHYQQITDSRPALINGETHENETEVQAAGETDDLGELPHVSDKLPNSLSRGLSQKGLWGSRPLDGRIPRRFGDAPKRRWTVIQDQ